MDGLGSRYGEKIKTTGSQCADVVNALRESRTDVVVNYLPVGSKEATEWWAKKALEAQCAFVNCIPEFIASDPQWQGRFREAKLPLVGDAFVALQNGSDNVTGYLDRQLGAFPRIEVHSILAVLLGIWTLVLFIRLILWSYQKRYVVTSRRLVILQGIISRKKEQIQLLQIRDISVKQSTLQRILGIGRVEVFSTDKSVEDLVIEDIPRPEKFSETLSHAWQEVIQQRGLTMV